MSGNPTNPYSTPVEVPDPAYLDSAPEQLAGRVTRLGSAILDGILMGLFLVPIQYSTGYLQRTQLQQTTLGEQLLMSLLGLVVFLALNGYLLAKRGQTIGKVAGSIQIVDYGTGRLLPFMRVYVLRYLWTLPLVLIVTLIPGLLDDYLFNLVILVDVLMIFGPERRCLHDRIAGSKVVIYRVDREPLEA
jgi:uncharacterized RDD family membrane protein YckC